MTKFFLMMKILPFLLAMSSVPVYLNKTRGTFVARRALGAALLCSGIFIFLLMGLMALTASQYPIFRMGMTPLHRFVDVLWRPLVVSGAIIATAVLLGRSTLLHSSEAQTTWINPYCERCGGKMDTAPVCLECGTRSRYRLAVDSG